MGKLHRLMVKSLDLTGAGQVRHEVYNRSYVSNINIFKDLHGGALSQLLF
jgi:hypothetical protein